MKAAALLQILHRLGLVKESLVVKVDDVLEKLLIALELIGINENRMLCSHTGLQGARFWPQSHHRLQLFHSMSEANGIHFH